MADDAWGGVGLACIDCGVAGAPVGECDDDLDDAGTDVRRRSIWDIAWTGLGAGMFEASVGE